MKLFHLFFLFLPALGLFLSACSEEEPASEPLDGRLIESFVFQGFVPPAVGVIDNERGIVTVRVPFGAGRTNLAPTITVSEGATIDPPSGEARNYSDPVLYVVTSESGLQKDYSVLVEAEGGSSSEAGLKSVTLPGLYLEGDINEGDKTINFEVPFGTDVSTLEIAVETTDPDASSSPASGDIVDLSAPLSLVVTAPDGVTNNSYELSVAVLPQDTAIRGVWLTNVDSDVLTSQEKIQAAVGRCSDLNINAIFVVTYNKAATTYPSQVMDGLIGRPIDPLYAGRDPLRELIDAAHARGIKVFAWFEYGFAAFYGSPGPILEAYPSWAAINSSGEPVVKNGFHWLNPMLPEVRGFMEDLILEVANNYPDIDGVQGDDRLPAMPSEGGYDGYTVSLYQAEHGGQSPPANRTNPVWLQWRADILNAWAEELYQKVKQANPNCIVAMSPSPLTFGFSEYLQDYTAWIEGGYCDIVSPQLYRRDNQGIEVYRGLLQDQLVRVGNTNKDIFYPGLLSYLGGYVPNPQFFVDMVRTNRAHGVQGEVHFFYNALIANEEVFRVVYPGAALFPEF